jgi:hypothetical protein
MQQGAGFDIYEHMKANMGGAVCPLCRGVGGVEPHGELILVCKLCGGPRIVLPEGVTMPEIGRAMLAKADAARKQRGLMRALGLGAMALAAFGAVVAIPVAWLSVTWALLTLVFFEAPAITTIVATGSQRERRTKEIAESLDAAWAAAAGEVVRAGRAKNAGELARALGVDDARAAQLFTMLSVDAEIGALGAEGLRIDTTGPTQLGLAPDPRFAALEDKAKQIEAEALREAEAAAEAETALDEKHSQAKKP